jgi:hypothetical protein
MCFIVLPIHGIIKFSNPGNIPFFISMANVGIKVAYATKIFTRAYLTVGIGIGR